MSVVMSGSEVVSAMRAEILKEVGDLRREGTVPGLAVVRLGERTGDLAYERNMIKKCAEFDIKCNLFTYSDAISPQEFTGEFSRINDDARNHGIIVLRPIPAHLDEGALNNLIRPEKDIDCMSPVNMVKVFSGDESGFAPCTPEAVMEVLDHFRIPVQGKRVVVLGRSMVVGKPLSMLLLKRNATVTICHTKTQKLEEVCKSAEILISAAGRAKVVTEKHVGEGAVVVDVGINAGADGKICGDVDFDRVKGLASYITPVPGGVGTITTYMLFRHLLRAAKTLKST
jgi:methylenetetrahydrofolate dehydrogenase (NADP+)/methenyltetrahydrofolate cyclohydrolase